MTSVVLGDSGAERRPKLILHALPAGQGGGDHPHVAMHFVGDASLVSGNAERVERTFGERPEQYDGFARQSVRLDVGMRRCPSVAFSPRRFRQRAQRSELNDEGAGVVLILGSDDAAAAQGEQQFLDRVANDADSARTLVSATRNDEDFLAAVDLLFA